MLHLVKLYQKPIIQRCIRKSSCPVSRILSTSNKEPRQYSRCSPPPPEPAPWVSYGFDYENEKDDRDAHHASFFFGVTLCLVFGGFAWAYAPDTLLRDWAQREAFLELKRRESGGSGVISPFYVNPGDIDLPTDEELGDFEIII